MKEANLILCSIECPKCRAVLSFALPKQTIEIHGCKCACGQDIIFHLVRYQEAPKDARHCH